MNIFECNVDCYMLIDNDGNELYGVDDFDGAILEAECLGNISKIVHMKCDSSCRFFDPNCEEEVWHNSRLG